MMRKTIGALAVLVLTAAAWAAETGKPVRVLIVTGANVHDWPKTTPLLKSMYEACPRFKIAAVLEAPTKLDAAAMDACDVVVSNFTKHPKMTEHGWGAAAEKALTDGVKAGKGFVAFHAACSADQDWPEIQQLFGVTWKWNETGHTQYHPFKVEMTDVDHPITRGVPAFWIVDELYQKMWQQTPVDFQVLARAGSDLAFGGTNKYEPMLLVTSLGKGRGVNFLPGHDVAAMENTGFKTLMLRGTEWAATGEVTVPVPKDWPRTCAEAVARGVDPEAVIKEAAGYKWGESRKSLLMLEQVVIAANALGKAGVERRAAIASSMAKVLGSDAAPEAKVFFCRQLSGIATDAEVPAIAALLADEKISYGARDALERIPGAAAAAALRSAVSAQTQPAPQSLRWRKEDGVLALLTGDRVVWQFNYGKTAPKPFFHPVSLMDGSLLTVVSPADHKWHRGLWFSWKVINGVNYWEEAASAKGRTTVVSSAIETSDDGAARIDLVLAYGPEGGVTVLGEDRSIRVSPPDAAGGYTIDWRSVFTPAAGELVFKGGTTAGGYAGMAARMSQNSRDWELIDSEGRRDVPIPKEHVTRNTQGQPSRWLDFSLVDKATGQPAGLAILDHPSNLRFPSKCHCIMNTAVNFGYMNPAPLFSESYTLAADGKLTLKYRVLVHAGRGNAEALEKTWRAFAQ